MGMYDTLICDLDLPELNETSQEFQTKSFDKFDETYRIDMFGNLFKIKKDEILMTKIDYTGYVNFYRIIKNIFFEYKTKFTDGECIKIELVEKRILERDAHRDKLRVAWANGEMEN